MRKHSTVVAAPPLIWNRPRLRFIEGAADEGGTGEKPAAEKTEATFTQADVNRIVKERLERQAKNEFGDYADLKAKAEGARTLEQQVADLTAKHAESEARALRSDVAARHGISAEDRDLFLTGSDEDTLIAQAKRLAERESDRKKHGNVAPREGDTKNTGKSDPKREWLRSLKQD